MPSFAGAYYTIDENGIVVRVTDGSSSSAAQSRDALADYLGDDVLAQPLIVNPARYSFTQLKLWQSLATLNMFGLPGVSTSDMDEAANAVRIGVEDPSTQEAAVRQVGTALGIPPDALMVEEDHPEKLLTSLRDLHRPLVGGLQIETRLSDTLAFDCTLGFTALRQGVVGFVTNSHCTGQMGVLESTRNVGQPDEFTIVGRESVDPPLFIGAPCPAGWTCRWADSVFVRLTSPAATIDRGRVARPQEIVFPFDWNGIAKWKIKKEEGLLMNEGVFKVGRTTGSTGERVSETCADVVQTETGFLMLCQGRTSSTFGQGGDSGSPVMQLEGTAADGPVSLKGLLWGSRTFSPIANIQKTSDLGALKNCHPDFTC